MQPLCLIDNTTQGHARLGSVDLNTVKKVEVTVREEDKIRQERFALRPSLSEILNLHDFEVNSTDDFLGIFIRINSTTLGYC